MKNIKDPSKRVLTDILDNIRKGIYLIPDFQRDYDWNASDIKELIDSIFNDYYIGNLLLWSANEINKKLLNCKSIYGYKETNQVRDFEYIVLDGQQRLTSIYYAFFAPDIPLKNKKNPAKFYIEVDRFLNENSDVIVYETFPNKIKQLQDRNYQIEHKKMPLEILLEQINSFQSPWFCKYAEMHGKEEAIDVNDKLKEVIYKYNIAHIELAKNISIDKVCDIFEKVNSRGIKLDTFDLLNAILKTKGIQLRTELWNKSKKELDFIDDKKRMYILQTMSILKQEYCSPKYLSYLIPGAKKPIRNKDGKKDTKILIDTKDSFINLWNDAVCSIKKSTDILKSQNYGVKDDKYLPYKSMLHIFSALNHFIVKNKEFDTEKNREKLRNWWFISILNKRYDSAVDSTAAKDYSDMVKWFKSDNIPYSVEEFIEDFISNGDKFYFKNETKKGTAVYNLLLNIILINGAKDFYTGEPGDINELDDHHIVPVSKQSELGIGEEINSILNRTMISTATNKKIRNLWPKDYLQEIESKKSNNPQEIFESHLISTKAIEILKRDRFDKIDFEEFMKEREKCFYNYIYKKILRINTQA